MPIPKLPERLSAMVCRRQLEIELEEQKPELHILKRAVSELRGNHKFKEMLCIVLVMGNTLNGTSFRGGAVGFRLASLSKVRLFAF